MSHPLCNPELELATVGIALHGWAKYAAEGLTAAHYDHPPARWIHEAAERAQEAHGATNPGAVAVEARRVGTLEKLGGREAIKIAYDSAHAGDAGETRRFFALRAALQAAENAKLAALKGDLSGASEALLGFSPDVGGSRVKTSADVVASVFRRIMQKDDSRRVHPGDPVVRAALGDLSAGSVTLIGADSNVGKSQMCLEMLIAASERNVTCGYISLEDPEELVGTRLLSSYSDVSSRDIWKGRADPDRLQSGVARVKSSANRMLMATLIGGTEVDVMAAMGEMAGRGARMVVVDYLGCIEPSRQQQDARNASKWITTRLKGCAERLGLALILATQITVKDGEQNKRPGKHSIRESRDVMHKAESVLLMWREKEGDREPVKVWVAKHKSGGVGLEWQMGRDRNGRLRLLETPDWARDEVGRD